MSGARLLYNAMLPVAEVAAHATAPFLPKMRAALSGRRGFRARWEALARTLTARPVWFHVASVGEFEQAHPVITALGAARPDVPVIVTFSSPSGYEFARRRETIGNGPIRFIDYLPIDRAGNMRACLGHADPRALVLVKFDVWPNLVWETSARSVPIVLIDATLSASSRRLYGPARWLYRRVYRAIDRILAISDADARRFAAGVPGHPAISVAGDTRFDRVMERWNARAASSFTLPASDLPTVIAGSTWPPDEARLLPALARLLAERKNLRVVLVPHEPDPGHVEPLRRWAQTTGVDTAVASTGVSPGARIVIVDRVGVLAEMYRYADVVYVGGAFTTGVHSVIEPAIAGVPVLFGPRHQNSLEALTLVELGAAVAVTNAGDTYTALARFLDNTSVREQAGAAARAYVASQLGATEKCMAALLPYL